MKLTVDKLRNLVKEELMHGIPNHRFDRLVDDFVEDVRTVIKNHINSERSRTQGERQQAFIALDATMDDLEKETSELLKSKLEEFSHTF